MLGEVWYEINVEAAEFTFWQQFVLNAIGPLVTVLVGSLAVGLVVAKVSARNQDRRAEGQLRRDLVAETIEITAQGWYAYDVYQGALKDATSDEERAEIRRNRALPWHEEQIRNEVVGFRLETHSESAEVATSFRDARRVIRILERVADGRFPQEDRAYWTRWEREYVEKWDKGELSVEELGADFRDRAAKFTDLILTSRMWPMA